MVLIDVICCGITRQSAAGGKCEKLRSPPLPPSKKKYVPQNTVIEDSVPEKKVVYKQIKHKPLLIKSNAVNQIYCIHVVYRRYTENNVNIYFGCSTLDDIDI